MGGDGGEEVVCFAGEVARRGAWGDSDVEDAVCCGLPEDFVSGEVVGGEGWGGGEGARGKGRDGEGGGREDEVGEG